MGTVEQEISLGRYGCGELVFELKKRFAEVAPGSTVRVTTEDPAAANDIPVCTPCLTKRGLTAEDLIEGAEAAGGVALVEWLSNDPASVGY